jgi:hypothetical protein
MQHKVDVRVRDENGRSIFHLAAMSKNAPTFFRDFVTNKRGTNSEQAGFPLDFSALPHSTDPGNCEIRYIELWYVMWHVLPPHEVVYFDDGSIS